MKDAKGHGSDPRGGHSAGVQKIGRPIAVSKRAINIIKKNATTGFSVKPNGQVPKSGFQIAMQGRTDKNPIDLNNIESHVAAHVEANRDVYASPHTYIGGWNSPYTGKVHLEPSRTIPDRDVAVKLGVARNQVSIWDNHRMQDIPTGGTGK
jgi:hypothetical protein